MSNMYTLLGYIIAPALLGLNYYYDESVWLYLYSLMCIGLIIFLVLGGIGIIIVFKDLGPKSVQDLAYMAKGISGWKRILGYFYGVAAFLYLAFTHHYFIAILSIFTSALAWLIVAMFIHEVKRLKVKS